MLWIHLLVYSGLGTSDRLVHTCMLLVSICTHNEKSYFLPLPHVNKLYHAIWHTKQYSFHHMTP